MSCISPPCVRLDFTFLNYGETQPGITSVPVLSMKCFPVSHSLGAVVVQFPVSHSLGAVVVQGSILTTPGFYQMKIGEEHPRARSLSSSLLLRPLASFALYLLVSEFRE